MFSIVGHVIDSPAFHYMKPPSYYVGHQPISTGSTLSKASIRRGSPGSANRAESYTALPVTNPSAIASMVRPGCLQSPIM
jgi:hypothetical protein